MFVIAQIFALLAALLHVAIFVMESFIFTRPAIYSRFGIKSQQDAETIRPMAYNQGFYNLFLAIGIFVGLVLISRGGEGRIAGSALVAFACASMGLAAIVLITTGQHHLRAALTQGTLPLLALFALALS
jgi:putative membrane protein